MYEVAIEKERNVVFSKKKLTKSSFRVVNITRKRFEHHEFVIRLWCPGIELDALLHCNHQETYALETDDLEVDAPRYIGHVRPSIMLVHLVRMLYTQI